jgi:hypothetical protein
MRVKDDAASSGRRLTDAQRRTLRRLIRAVAPGTATETPEVAALAAYFLSLHDRPWFAPGSIAYLELTVAPYDERGIASALSDLTRLADCEDWGTDPCHRTRGQYRPLDLAELDPLDLDDFDAEPNGNGHLA